MAAYSLHTDQELAVLLQGGDHAAFTEIYKRFWPLLFRHARKMLRDDDEATDLIQELFADLWGRREDRVVGSSLSGFLYQATKNKVFNFIKRDKVRVNYIASIQEFFEKGEYMTDNMVIERELARRIESEIALLPGKMREIFELSRKEHLSYKEISERLDISEGTVKKQVYNALKILKLKFDLILLLSYFFYK